MRLIDSVQVRKDPDGDGLVVDDRTLTIAHVNEAACVLLEALRQPRTYEELATILAVAANCATVDAVTPVARLLDELRDFGWIEPARPGAATNSEKE
jgi:hypothetical protein